MVSQVAQPAMPLAIFLHHQASKFVSSCQALCRALSWSASSVGCSSSEDDPLESLGGVPSLGLGWHHFHWMDWIFSLGSDSESVSSCIPKTWLMPVRVSWIWGHPCPSLPSDATWPLLKTSTSPLLASAFSSSWGGGVSSSLWENLDLLLDSWPLSVTWEWAKPDCGMRQYFGHGCMIDLWSPMAHQSRRVVGDGWIWGMIHSFTWLAGDPM